MHSSCLSLANRSFWYLGRRCPASFPNTQQVKTYTGHRYILSEDEENTKRVEILHVNQTTSATVWT